MYDFTGNCDYVLARGHMTATDSFQITIKNVPCGTSPVTCSKAASIVVGSGTHREILQIVKGEEPVVGPAYRRISMRDVGLMVSFEVFDLGLVVQWDKANRLYVRLKPRWQGRVSGLCGNFNSDNSDDFKTPSGLTEAAPEIFGDSWKVHNYCPRASTIQVSEGVTGHDEQLMTGHVFPAPPQETVVYQEVRHPQVPRVQSVQGRGPSTTVLRPGKIIPLSKLILPILNEILMLQSVPREETNIWTSVCSRHVRL